MPVSKGPGGEPITKVIEGEYRYWDYGTRDGLGELQVFRNFETALKTAGFTIDYEQSPNIITAHKGGASAANQTLSDARAKSVVAWLVAHGVPAARLTAKGFGQTNPVADNATADGRTKNRRVELHKL